MNNTIFDDVFRTMIEKMLYLAVPLINEVFHTSYPEDVKIADYIFRKEEDVRKGIGDIMGGKVLELESERLKTEGMIAGAIKTCKKFKLDQEASVKNIMEEFSLSEEDASNYVKKYW